MSTEPNDSLESLRQKGTISAMSLASPKRARDDPGGTRAGGEEGGAVVISTEGAPAVIAKPTAKNIATISSGFEKGDFLVREEKGMRVYFDFFEEAFNYISNRGYIRMSKEEEEDWIQLMNHIHSSVKGGMRYNTGKLLMVLYRPIEEKSSGGHNKSDTGGSADAPK